MIKKKRRRDFSRRRRTREGRTYCFGGIVDGSLVLLSINDADVRMFVPLSTVTVAKPQSTSGAFARFLNGSGSCRTRPAGMVRLYVFSDAPFASNSVTATCASVVPPLVTLRFERKASDFWRMPIRLTVWPDA